MTLREYDDQYNLTGMIARPLYFGMFFNVLLPAALLFVCYYINNHYYIENSVPDMANTLFYMFAVMALLQAGLAFWWRNRSLDAPMVHRKETFEQDISRGLFERSLPIFLLIASTSVWGYLYFFLTGRFREAVLFVVLSFVLFQVVRPRYGSVRKLIAYQERLVEQGRFLPGSSGLS